jgi:ribosome assembly protein YihI (activator of Der GTPase)
MSRSKKSRKPGTGSIGIVKDDKKKVVIVADKKPKKKSGKKPGNRQQEAMENQSQHGDSSITKDPRIGSKKAIDLGVPTPKKSVKTATPKSQKSSPIAAIRVIEKPPANNEALEQELYAIEDDKNLQSIIEKQESDIELTEAEVNFFNEKMTRHQELRELLGWADDEEEEDNDETSTEALAEDALWDKLDNTDFSKFE